MMDAVLSALEEAHEQTGEPLLAFYLALRSWTLAQRASLPERVTPPSGVSKLARDGRPLLNFKALGLQAAAVHAALAEIAELWEQLDPGASSEIAELSPGEALALAKEWFHSGQSGRGATVDALLANALAPRLEWIAEGYQPYVPAHLWALAACPICGGWPDFALWREEGDTPLICERCRATWEAALQGCFYCGETDPEQRGLYVSEDERYTVEVCDTCGYYLKGMLESALTDEEAPLLAAERFLTPGLDLLALQEGYMRPEGLAREPET